MVMVDTSTEYMARRWYEAVGDPRFARARRRQRSQGRRTMLRAERLARTGALAPGAWNTTKLVGELYPDLTPAVNAAREAQLTSPASTTRRPGCWSEQAHLATTSSAEVDCGSASAARCACP